MMTITLRFQRLARLALFLTACLAFANGAGAGVVVTVNAGDLADDSGISVAPGQTFLITATGSVNLATGDGPYITDPNGTILQAPPAGSGAYLFFSGQAPVGPLTIGGFKDIGPSPPGISVVRGSPFGMLVAGFARTPNPDSISDFPSGFKPIGALGYITAPAGASYLFLGVNDFEFSHDDDDGSFTATVSTVSSAVPEPSSLVVATISAVGGLLALARRRRANGA